MAIRLWFDISAPQPKSCMRKWRRKGRGESDESIFRCHCVNRLEYREWGAARTFLIRINVLPPLFFFCLFEIHPIDESVCAESKDNRSETSSSRTWRGRLRLENGPWTISRFGAAAAPAAPADYYHKRRRRRRRRRRRLLTRTAAAANTIHLDGRFPFLLPLPFSRFYLSILCRPTDWQKKENKRKELRKRVVYKSRQEKHSTKRAQLFYSLFDECDRVQPTHSKIYTLQKFSFDPSFFFFFLLLSSSSFSDDFHKVTK